MTEQEMATTLSAMGYKIERVVPVKSVADMSDSELGGAEESGFSALRRAHHAASDALNRIHDVRAERFHREMRKPSRRKQLQQAEA